MKGKDHSKPYKSTFTLMLWEPNGGALREAMKNPWHSICALDGISYHPLWLISQYQWKHMAGPINNHKMMAFYISNNNPALWITTRQWCCMHFTCVHTLILAATLQSKYDCFPYFTDGELDRNAGFQVIKGHFHFVSSASEGREVCYIFLCK